MASLNQISTSYGGPFAGPLWGDGSGAGNRGRFHSAFTVDENNPIYKRTKYCDDRSERGQINHRIHTILAEMENDGKITEAERDEVMARVQAPLPVQLISRAGHGFTGNKWFHVTFTTEGPEFNFRDHLDQVNHEAAKEIVHHMNTFLNRRGSGQAGDARFTARSDDTTARHYDPAFGSRGDHSSGVDMIWSDLRGVQLWVAAPSTSPIKTDHARDVGREEAKKTPFAPGCSSLEAWMKEFFNEEFKANCHKIQVAKILFVKQFVEGRRGQMPEEEIALWITSMKTFLGAGAFEEVDVRSDDALFPLVLCTVDEFRDNVSVREVLEKIRTSGLIKNSQEADREAAEFPPKTKEWLFGQPEGILGLLYAFPVSAQSFANAGPQIGKDCVVHSRVVPIDQATYRLEVPPASGNWEAVPLKFSDEVQHRADTDSDDLTRFTQTIFHLRELDLMRQLIGKLRVAGRREVPPAPEELAGQPIRDQRILDSTFRAKIQEKVDRNDAIYIGMIALIDHLLLTGRPEFTDAEEIRLSWLLNTIRTGVPWNGASVHEVDAISWHQSLSGMGNSPGDPFAAMICKGRTGITLVLDMEAEFGFLAPKVKGMIHVPWNGADGHYFAFNGVKVPRDEIGTMTEVTEDQIRVADGIPQGTEISPENADPPSRLRWIQDKIALRNMLFTSCAISMRLSDQRRSTKEGHLKAKAGVISQEPLSHSVFVNPIRVGVPEYDRTVAFNTAIYAKQIPSALFKSPFLRVQMRGFMSISDSPDAGIGSLRTIGYAC